MSSNYSLSSNSLTDTVVRSPAEAGPVDYVVCAHKAIDQEDVAKRLAPVVDQERTTIVIIQNGVGNEEAFRNQFPKSSILTCVVSSSRLPQDSFTWSLN
jgi:ketopantoate reductase